MDIASTLPRPAATMAPSPSLREPTAPPPFGGGGDTGSAGTLADDLMRRAADSVDASVHLADGLKTAARQVDKQIDGMKRALFDSLTQALRAIGLSRRDAEAWAKGVVGKLSESKRDDVQEAGRQAVLQVRSTDVQLTLKVENLSLTAEAGGRQLSIDTTKVSISLSVTSVAATIRGGRAGPGRPPEDPLVFDLDGNGVDLTTVDKGVFWDLNGDAKPEQIAWIKGGDALLALDRNGNGRIDDGTELFGDQHGAADGLAELAKFDGNGDGAIDRADPVFGSLVLLRPEFSQTGLKDAGIDRIRLDLAVPVGQRLAGGTLDAAAPVETSGGGTIAAAAVRLDLRA